MIITTAFQHKTLVVQAIQITVDNMKEVAEWCGGSVKKSQPTGYSQRYPYVEVVVGHIAGRTQLARAAVGMWITCLTKDNNFRVYKARSFDETFLEIMSEEEKRGKIRSLVEELTSDETIVKDFTEHFLHVLD